MCVPAAVLLVPTPAPAAVALVPKPAESALSQAMGAPARAPAQANRAPFRADRTPDHAQDAPDHAQDTPDQAQDAPVPADHAPVEATVELRLTSVDEPDAKVLERMLWRQLSDRLLQDGYRVVPDGETASVGVWIHLGARDVRVQTRGTQERVETVSGGDPQVVALEILQLTTALVDEVRPDASPRRTAVALQLSGEPLDPQLREHLQAGLLARGFALTRQPTPEDRRLCVSTDTAGSMVHVVGGTQPCDFGSATRHVITGQSVEMQRLRLLDTATSTLSTWRPETEPAPEPEPPTTTEASRTETPLLPDLDDEYQPLTAPEHAGTRPPAEPADTPKVGSFTATAHGGVMGRSGGTDGMFGLRLRAGRQRGFGGGLELTMAPSTAEWLSIFEAMPSALADWRLGFGSRGLAIFGIFGGLHVHRFVQDSPGGRRGTRLGPGVGTTIRLAFLGRRGLMAFGGIRAGWSGGRWVHVIDGRTVWHRSPLLVGLEVGVGWDFPWRRRP